MSEKSFLNVVIQSDNGRLLLLRVFFLRFLFPLFLIELLLDVILLFLKDLIEGKDGDERPADGRDNQDIIIDLAPEGFFWGSLELVH